MSVSAPPMALMRPSTITITPFSIGGAPGLGRILPTLMASLPLWASAAEARAKSEAQATSAALRARERNAWGSMEGIELMCGVGCGRRSLVVGLGRARIQDE